MRPRPTQAQKERERVSKVISRLENSAINYDRGHEIAAYEIAVAIRVLLHDTRSSHGALNQHSLKSQMQFLDTSWRNVTNSRGAGPFVTQIEYELEDGTRYFARSKQDGLITIANRSAHGKYIPLREEPEDLLRPHRFVAFDPWWTEGFMDFPSGAKVSRQALVLAIVNKDGGAHVDPKGLNADYDEFIYRGFGVMHSNRPEDAAGASSASFEFPEGDPALASVRQIGHELLVSMSRDSALQTWLASK